MKERLRDAIYGFAVGDAVGVPYEFKWIGTFECTDMVGHGTWDQPRGTWSDDTSMTLATCDSIRRCGKIDCLDLMERFTAWAFGGEYAIDGNVFDIGNTVSRALHSFDGKNPHCGIDDPMQNGNGALMRILPLAFVDGITDNEIATVAKLTHGHDLSAGICTSYVRKAQALLRGEEVDFPFSGPTIPRGFVKDTWNCVNYALATTDTYRDCILAAVNLGGDSDTIAAIAGGLAGIIYGYEGIPKDWIDGLRGKDIIESCLF